MARKSEWVKLELAAQDVERSPATLRRWVRLGLVSKRKNQPGTPRAVFVDLNQVRRIRDQGIPSQND